MLAPYHTPGIIEAGCDEAGRGCLAGPVFAAAVILPEGFVEPLLNDSKQLSAKSRVYLREQIEAKAMAYAVSMVLPGEIDRINILNASILAMHKAVDSLKVTPARLLIDGNRFKPYHGIAHLCMVKGDARFASIAAASVLAKTYRDEFMLGIAKDYPGYHWEMNKGYPTKEHRKAITSLGVTPHHRKSFRLMDAQTRIVF